MLVKKAIKAKPKSASCPLFLSETWISAARKATIPLFWPSLRLFLLRILKMSPLKKLKTQNSHISCVQKIARLPTQKIGRTKRRNIVASKLGKTLGLPQPLVLIWWKLMKGFAKIWARSAATITLKKDII